MKVKKWVPRLFFFAFLAVAGFAVEYFFYHRQIQTSVSKDNSEKKRLLIVSGSIGHNIAEGVRAYLSSQSLGQKYLVSNFIQSSLITSFLATHFNDLLEIYHPNIIFLLVGMNEQVEVDRINDKTQALEDIATAKIIRGQDIGFKTTLKLMEFVQRKMIKESTDEFIKIVQHAYEASDRETFGDLFWFLVYQHDASVNILDTSRILNYLSQTISDRIKSNAGSIDPLNNLIRLAMIIDRSGERLGVRQLELDAHPEKVSESFKIFRKNFERLVKEGSKKILKDGPEKFLEDESFFSFYDRAWLLVSYPRQKLNTATTDFYFSQNYYLMAYIGILYYFKDIKDAGQVGPGEIDFVKKIRQFRSYVENLHLNIDIKGMPPSSYENLLRIKKICDEKKIILVLLQYPNSHKSYIDRAGKMLGVPVIDGKKIFDGLVSESSREKYFVDRIGDTGHMTPLGASLYGKSLIHQSLNILP